MARPSSVFSWAAVSAIWRATVPTLNRDQGFQPLTAAVAEYVNQALYEVGTWIGFVEAFFPADKRLDVGRITGTGDPVGGVAGLVITTDGTGSGILIQPPVNDGVRIETTGTGIAVVTAAAGGTASLFAGTSGILVSGPNSSFAFTAGAEGGLNLLRYPYRAAAPLTLTLPMWPGMGGWSTFNGANTALIAQNEGAGRWSIYNQDVAAKTVSARRPIHEFTGNAEASTAIYEVTAFSVTFTAPGTATVKLIRKTKAGTSLSTLITLTGASPSWTGTQAIDPVTYDYFVEFEQTSVSAGTNSDLVEEVTMTIRKYAVE